MQTADAIQCHELEHVFACFVIHSLHDYIFAVLLAFGIGVGNLCIYHSIRSFVLLLIYLIIIVPHLIRRTTGISSLHIADSYQLDLVTTFVATNSATVCCREFLNLSFVGYFTNCMPEMRLSINYYINFN